MCNFEETGPWQEFRNTFGYEGPTNPAYRGIAFLVIKTYSFKEGETRYASRLLKVSDLLKQKEKTVPDGRICREKGYSF